MAKSQPLDKKAKGGMRSSGLSGSQIPEKYSPKEKLVPIPNSKRFELYKIKSSIYQGLQKQKSNVTGQSQYVSFRRVSENSPAASWIHSGFQAKNFADKALEGLKIEFILGRVIDNFLNSI
jgi:hypothetical protein